MREPTPEVRRWAAEAWAFRWSVEREAERRFLGIAERLAAERAPDAVTELARKAGADEALHTRLCAELAGRYGIEVDPSQPVEVPEIAPTAFNARQALTYDLVSACCVTETESAGVLTTLLSADPDPEVRAVLHQIARDEVDHARLGWAWLAHVSGTDALSYLAPTLPSMLSGTVPDSLFQPAARPEQESAQLLWCGVLPHTQKRSVFVRMLREVVFPGLANFAIDVAPAEAWLASRAS